MSFRSSYGGEEMALILPHTDLEAAHAIAQRVRITIEGLRIPRLDRDGGLQVTAGVGVGASSAGDKEELSAQTDAALYVAKRSGKNRIVQAGAQTTNVVGAE
jgi:two-component system cell cycle response regulator